MATSYDGSSEIRDPFKRSQLMGPLGWKEDPISTSPLKLQFNLVRTTPLSLSTYCFKIKKQTHLKLNGCSKKKGKVQLYGTLI